MHLLFHTQYAFFYDEQPLLRKREEQNWEYVRMLSSELGASSRSPALSPAGRGILRVPPLLSCSQPAANSLSRNILPLSPRGSRFCLPSFISRTGNPMKTKILQGRGQKNRYEYDKSVPSERPFDTTITGSLDSLCSASVRTHGLAAKQV